MGSAERVITEKNLLTLQTKKKEEKQKQQKEDDTEVDGSRVCRVWNSAWTDVFSLKIIIVEIIQLGQSEWRRKRRSS